MDQDKCESCLCNGSYSFNSDYGIQSGRGQQSQVWCRVRPGVEVLGQARGRGAFDEKFQGQRTSQEPLLFCLPPRFCPYLRASPGQGGPVPIANVGPGPQTLPVQPGVQARLAEASHLKPPSPWRRSRPSSPTRWEPLKWSWMSCGPRGAPSYRWPPTARSPQPRSAPGSPGS